MKSKLSNTRNTSFSVPIPVTTIFYNTGECVRITLNFSVSVDLQFPPPRRPKKIPIALEIEEIEREEKNSVKVKVNVLIPPHPEGYVTLIVDPLKQVDLYVKTENEYPNEHPLESFQSIASFVAPFFRSKDDVEIPNENLLLYAFLLDNSGTVGIKFTSTYPAIISPHTPKVIINYVKDALRKLKREMKSKILTVTTKRGSPPPEELIIPISLTNLKMSEESYLEPTIHLTSFHLSIEENTIQYLRDKKFLSTWLMIKEPKPLELISYSLPPNYTFSDVEFSVILSPFLKHGGV